MTDPNEHAGLCHVPGHIHREPGECRRCIDGQIQLPPDLYDPAVIACPWCQPQQYPDGFPGLRANPGSHWLIPPGATNR